MAECAMPPIHEAPSLVQQPPPPRRGQVLSELQRLKSMRRQALGAEAAALDLSIETLVFALRAPQAPGSWHAMATWAKSVALEELDEGQKEEMPPKELHQDGVVLSSSERPDDERQEKLEVPTSDPPEPPEPVERAAELAEPGERAAEPVEPAERAAERAAEPVEPEERAAAVEPQPADEPASHEKWHVEKTPDETQEEKPEPASVYPQFYADRRCPLDAAKSEHQEEESPSAASRRSRLETARRCGDS
ncbi:unnamed protein product, partial [Durusdinium trenchii]